MHYIVIKVWIFVLVTCRPAYQPACLPANLSTCLHVYLSTYLIFHLIRNYIIAENNFTYIPTPFYFREGNSAIVPNMYIIGHFVEVSAIRKPKIITFSKTGYQIFFVDFIFFLPKQNEILHTSKC